MLRSSSSSRAASGRVFHSRSLMWPDPDVPCCFTSNDNNKQQQQENSLLLLADNVSGLQETNVSAFFYPRCVDDVREVVKRARFYGKKISMRGTKHCMGAHQMANSCYVIDLSHMNKVLAVHPGQYQVACEPGALWSDILVRLNPHAQSIRTSQSYTTFSVGGSLAVAAHGITSDYTCAESVLSLDVMTPDGTVLTCTRDNEHSRLFQCVLGGFGMFGIIVKITMKTTPNDALLSDSFVCSIKDFPKLYEKLIEENLEDEKDLQHPRMGSVSIKLCRLNILTCDSVQCHLFRRRGAAPTVGQLNSTNSSAPREMSALNRLLYKWLLPPLKDVRFRIEEQTGSALDWAEALDKNSLMFETAEPLARLCEPLFLADDTFILQEYFVPKSMFSKWIDLARPIYRDVSDNEQPAENARVQLLNTTIRFVHKDADTALPYSRADEGCYAFVLYYRILRTAESESHLKKIHKRFVKATLDCGGSFFLCYLHHYDRDELLAAYPNFADFCQEKERFDPMGLFDSGWYREYGLQFNSPEYQDLFLQQRQRHNASSSLLSSSSAGGATLFHITEQPVEHRTAGKEESLPPLGNKQQQQGKKDFVLPIVSDRRNDSLRKLMNNVTMRTAFFSEFLVNVFSVLSPAKIEQALSRACWDPRNQSDADIYTAVIPILEKESDDIIGQATKAWKQLRQLSAQKQELTDETMRVLTRLGKLDGSVRDYVSIGDHGKLVRCLQRELKMATLSSSSSSSSTRSAPAAAAGGGGAGGKIRVIHDEPQPEDSVLVAVETGSSTPVGDFILANYAECQCKFPQVPSSSADLITLNQGIHHMPQEFVVNLLQEVERILRPGGVFITREHDCTPDLVPMCDAAHSIFNALTGVSVDSEAKEIRAFRPLSEWRRIITSCTALEDSMLFEIQKGDPTVDYMMAFYKPQKQHRHPVDPTATTTAVAEPSSSASATTTTTQQQQKKPMMMMQHPQQLLPFHSTVEQLPETILSSVRTALSSVAPLIETIGDKVASVLAPTEFHPAVHAAVRQYTEPIATAAARILKQTEHVKPRQLHIEAFPSEVYHGYFALETKVNKGKATAMEALLVTTVQNALSHVLGGGGGGDKKNNVASSDAAAPLSAAASSSSFTNNQQYTAAGDQEEPIEFHHEDIVSELRTFVMANPDIMQAEFLLDAGFPEPVVDVVQNLIPPSLVVVVEAEADDLDGDDDNYQNHAVVRVDPVLLTAAAVKLEKFLDSESWLQVKRHLRAIVQAKQPLTFDALLNRNQEELTVAANNRNDGEGGGKDNPKKKSNAWFMLLTSLLGSPKVVLTYPLILAARFYGVGELGELYNTAQEMRIARRSSNSMRSNANGDGDGGRCQQQQQQQQQRRRHHLPAAAAEEMENALSLLSSPVRHETFRGEADQIKNIYNVASVIQATYQGRDVTEIVKNFLWKKPATATSASASATATATATSASASASASSPSAASSTTTTRMVELEDLNLDSVFDFGLTPLSKFFYGERVFTLTYRSSSHRIPIENITNAAAIIKRSLRSSNLGTARNVGLGHESPAAAALHLYKLNEWMQVDVLKDMANSLDHTPWYRYPYMSVLSGYFTSLADVAGEVLKEHGARAAFMSNGFVVALVPGLVMGFFFAQLQLLAAPVAAVLGEAYNPDRLKSRLLVHISDEESSSSSSSSPTSMMSSPSSSSSSSSFSPSSTSSSLSSPDQLSTMKKVWPASFTAPSSPVVITPLHDNRLALVTLPVFGEFTSYLVELARHGSNNNRNKIGCSKITLLDVDGNTSKILIKVRQPKHDHLQKQPVDQLLRSRFGFDVRLVTSYDAQATASSSSSTQRSSSSSSSKGADTFAALLVPIPQLLEVIRVCENSGMKVVQVFDFYGA